jgi:hypothetical protein
MKLELDRLQSAFANTYRSACVPLWDRIRPFVAVDRPNGETTPRKTYDLGFDLDAEMGEKGRPDQDRQRVAR